MTVVAEAVDRIASGDLEKVVLARDLIASTDEPLDVRWPLHRLADQYEMCWTFHVDGLFGATPEMLVRRERGLVTSRVLAGTIRRTGDDERDLALAATLARSSKDLEEHEYAVRSVADALEPHCSSMNVPEAPFVLHLPNVMHLATDVERRRPRRRDRRCSWPSRCTPPRRWAARRPPDATRLIAEIEGMPRDRYAGPVGWMDASGDGEWGIALRSAIDHRQRRTTLRRLRHRRELRPRGRAGGVAGEVRAGARRARGRADRRSEVLAGLPALEGLAVGQQVGHVGGDHVEADVAVDVVVDRQATSGPPPRARSRRPRRPSATARSPAPAGRRRRGRAGSARRPGGRRWCRPDSRT